MPDEVRLQPAKMPFVSPMDDWARAALKPWLLDLCASRSFLESAIWNGPAVKVAAEQATVGRKSLWTIWPIINAYALEQSFKQRARQNGSQTLRKTGLDRHAPRDKISAAGKTIFAFTVCGNSGVTIPTTQH